MAHGISDSSLIKMRGEDVKVALYLLSEANIEAKKWYDRWKEKEILVRRGELITSTHKIAKALEETDKTVRTSIKRLSKGLHGDDGFLQVITNIEAKRANAYSHIRVIKYEVYQKPQNYKGELRANGGNTAVIPRGNHGQQLNKYNKENKDNKYNKETESSAGAAGLTKNPSDTNHSDKVIGILNQAVSKREKELLNAKSTRP